MRYPKIAFLRGTRDDGKWGPRNIGAMNMELHIRRFFP
jgi:hypothetical protein